MGSDCYVQGATAQETTPIPPATTPTAQTAPDIPTIAGAVVGGVCCLIVIVLLVYYLCRRPSRLIDLEAYTWLGARPPLPKPRVAIRATIDWQLQKPAPPPAKVPGARPQQVWQIRNSRWRTSGSSTRPRATT